jgi:hypothetical protein
MLEDDGRVDEKIFNEKYVKNTPGHQVNKLRIFKER